MILVYEAVQDKLRAEPLCVDEVLGVPMRRCCFKDSSEPGVYGVELQDAEVSYSDEGPPSRRFTSLIGVGPFALAPSGDHSCCKLARVSCDSSWSGSNVTSANVGMDGVPGAVLPPRSDTGEAVMPLAL